MTILKNNDFKAEFKGAWGSNSSSFDLPFLEVLKARIIEISPFPQLPPEPTNSAGLMVSDDADLTSAKAFSDLSTFMQNAGNQAFVDIFPPATISMYLDMQNAEAPALPWGQTLTKIYEDIVTLPPEFPINSFIVKIDLDNNHDGFIALSQLNIDPLSGLPTVLTTGITFVFPIGSMRQDDTITWAGGVVTLTAGQASSGIANISSANGPTLPSIGNTIQISATFNIAAYGIVGVPGYHPASTLTVISTNTVVLNPPERFRNSYLIGSSINNTANHNAVDPKEIKPTAVADPITGKYAYPGDYQAKPAILNFSVNIGNKNINLNKCSLPVIQLMISGFDAMVGQSSLFSVKKKSDPYDHNVIHQATFNYNTLTIT